MLTNTNIAFLLLCVAGVCVKGHAILRVPTAWNTAESTTSPCGGSPFQITPDAVWTVGTQQQIVWDVTIGDGVGPVTAAIDPAGGTNFSVPVLQNGPSTTTGDHNFTVTVPNVQCTGVNNVCVMQVKSSSNWFSCTSLQVLPAAVVVPDDAKPGKEPSGNTLVGDEATVGGKYITGSAVAAVLIVPAIIIVPLIGLYVASVLDKTAPLGKVDQTAAQLRGFFDKQSNTEVGQHSAQLQRVLVLSGLLSALQFIWSIMTAAYTTGPVGGMAVTSALFSVFAAAAGFYVSAYKRDRKFLIIYMAWTALTMLLEFIFVVLVLAYYSQVSSMASSSKSSLAAITAIFTFVAMLTALILPINGVAVGIARKIYKGISSNVDDSLQSEYKMYEENAQVQVPGAEL